MNRETDGKGAARAQTAFGFYGATHHVHDFFAD
jgi:hypothetical protein